MVVRFIPPQQKVSKGLLSSDDPLTPNSLLMPSTLDLPVQREDEQPNLMPNQNTTTNVMPGNELTGRQKFFRGVRNLGLALQGINPNAYDLQNQQIAAQRQKLIDDAQFQQDRRNIFKNTNRADFAEGTIGDKMYYRDLANNFMQLGDPDVALKFAELAKPVNDVEEKKMALDQNKLEGKEWGSVKEGIKNFRQIIDAAQDDSGAAAYSLMIKYIKNLDDSVVREGEVRTFGNFQGIYQNFLNEFQKASGKGFTPQIRNNLVQLAQKSVQSLVNDWNTYKANKTNDLYIPLGIDANQVFAGYGYEKEVDAKGQPTDVLFKTYTVDDFKDKGTDDFADDTYKPRNTFSFLGGSE